MRTKDGGKLTAAGLQQFYVSAEVHAAVRSLGGQGNIADGFRHVLLGAALACEPLSTDAQDATLAAVQEATGRYTSATKNTLDLQLVVSDLRQELARKAPDERLRKMTDRKVEVLQAAKQEEARCARVLLLLQKEFYAVEAGIGRGTELGHRTLAVRLDPVFRDIAQCLEAHYQITLRQIVYRALRTPAVTAMCQQIRRMTPADYSAVLQEAHRIWTSPTMSNSVLGGQGAAAVG